MARRKTVIVTFKRETLPNGNIKLSSPKGIIDRRNDNIYSEVVCKPRYERYFSEVESEA